MDPENSRQTIVLRFWLEQQESNLVWYCEMVNVQNDERVFVANLSMLTNVLETWLNHWLRPGKVMSNE